jgi:hypothetical protein
MNEEMKRVRETIARVVEGKLTIQEWDDRLSMERKDPAAEALRRIAWQVPDLFPVTKRPAFCSQKGLEFFKLLLQATSNQPD